MESRPQGFGPRFWAVVGATFLGFLGMGTVLPGIAPHVRHDLGGSDQTVGFVIGIFSLVALMSRFFSGPFADRKGRKAAFQVGLVSCALAGAAYLLPLGVAGAFLGRILQGFGEACLYTGAAAWAVETAGVERSGQALGYVSSGIWGGISAGPAIGTFLGSFHRAAAMQIFTAVVAFVIVSRVTERYQPHPHEGKRQWLPRRIIVPGIAIGFVNVHYPAIAGFLILHLGAANGVGRMAFTAYACMVLFSRFFFGGLPDRIHPAITFYGGLTLMAVGLLGIAAHPSAFLSVLSAGVLGLGFSFPWSSIAGRVLRETPASERGSAVGVISAFYDLFVGTSSFAAGAVAHRFGYSEVFLMGACGVGVAALIGRFVFWKKELVEPQVLDEVAVTRG